MAGDWIKVRVLLSRDPKVIRMAEWLLNEPRFRNLMHISSAPGTEPAARNVTVALCVTGLVVTWGVARERGDRNGFDLVLDCCRLSDLSTISDVPFFGEAMAHVGWVKTRGKETVIFPKFFKDNESPDDKHRRQNAERQARHRAKGSEKDSSVTVTPPRNVTVTMEKRREDIKPSTATYPQAKQASERPKPGHKNGHESQKLASFAAWMTDEAAALRKGESLGLKPNAGESWPAFRNRIIKAETKRTSGQSPH